MRNFWHSIAVTQIELNCYYSFSYFSHIKNISVALIIKSMSGSVQQEIQGTFPEAVQQQLSVRVLGLLSQVSHFIKLHPKQRVEKARQHRSPYLFCPLSASQEDSILKKYLAYFPLFLVEITRSHWQSLTTGGRTSGTELKTFTTFIIRDQWMGWQRPLRGHPQLSFPMENT